MGNGGSPKKWMRDEWKQIYIRRRRAFGASNEPLRDVDPAADSSVSEPKNLVGLSISGGGIRSALYNDGFLQGLSHRGLLRYVDYTCSVSGGGYIAGHLTSQAVEGEGECFHDDPKRFPMGRNPRTGKVDPERLAGVGGYLSRTLEFLPAYLWSFFFSFAFYFGAVGVLATLAALFWRTFDDPVFRSLYQGTLGLRAGSELMIAFIPTILLSVAGVLIELLLCVYRLFVGFDAARPRAVHLFLRKVFLLASVFAFFTSMAIFLGNGITNVRSDASGSLHLNKYAQWFAIVAGTVQVLVFLGRDRLFRSELGESSQLMKQLQFAVTTVVLLIVLFSMVHWMGREDISDYTSHRDPQLVQGDVSNWPVMNRLFAAYEPAYEPDDEEAAGERKTVSPETKQTPLQPNDDVSPLVKPQSKWLESLAASRIGGIDVITDEDLSQPQPFEEEYAQAWSLPKRLQGAVIAYWLAMTADRNSIAKEPITKVAKQEAEPGEREAAIANPAKEPVDDVAQEARSNDLNSESVAQFVRDAFVQALVARQQQVKRLEQWNEYLNDKKFTLFLLNGVHQNESWISSDVLNDKGEKIPGPKGHIAVLDPISKLVDSTEADISSNQRKNLLVLFRSLRLSNPDQQDGTGDFYDDDRKEDQGRAYATANRYLLEALFPGAIRRHDVASTLVVPPYDQRSRKRWLVFWMITLLVGTIGGMGSYRVATVFSFYRQQLASNFLVASHDHSRRFGDKELHELNPTHDGLPYPLMLAASLEPSTRNGSYHVEARPFVFSPMYSGHFDNDANPIPSKQLSFALNPLSPAVTLGDAVTLSGAAVTPLMTSNRWLSIILDFFNTGIGQRVRRVDRTDGRLARKSIRPLFLCFLFGVAVFLGAKYIVGLGWTTSAIAMTAGWLLAFCVAARIGTPGLIRLFVFPKTGHSYDKGRDAENDRSFYVADGGYSDYLGVSELLRRRCELIVVSDAGANIGSDPLGTLARMCENASRESGIHFLDLDHEAPIDFGRLEATDQRLVHQPYICMRVRYPEADRREGLLFYCQMSITETDPIEIQHIRNLFPSFPDEPTVNQFYTEQQVSGYRTLGYHIANRLCSELQTWKLSNETIVDEKASVATADRPADAEESFGGDESHVMQVVKASLFRNTLLSGHRCAMFPPRDARSSAQPNVPQLGQPMFRILKERLLTAYRLACYEEHSYREGDIFSEAIWPTSQFAFPTFKNSVKRVCLDRNGSLPDRWLREYELGADVRSAYRTAVISDINALDIGTECYCAILWSAFRDAAATVGVAPDRDLLAAHLTNIGTACQEVHRGRPHAAFQVGGRAKLINLSRSVADVICDTFKGQSEGRSNQRLLEEMDRVIAKLIELERSVFQGGEHVTNISFAQCMSAMWGRIARGNTEMDDDTTQGMFTAFLGGEHEPANDLNKKRRSPELRVVELRSDLDKGLNKMRLSLVRESLAKSWYLGYFTTTEIRELLAMKQQEVPEEKKPPAQRTRKKAAKPE